MHIATAVILFIMAAFLIFGSLRGEMELVDYLTVLLGGVLIGGGVMDILGYQGVQIAIGVVFCVLATASFALFWIALYQRARTAAVLTMFAATASSVTLGVLQLTIVV